MECYALTGNFLMKFQFFLLKKLLRGLYLSCHSFSIWPFETLKHYSCPIFSKFIFLHFPLTSYSLTLPPHIKNKPWISCKIDKAVKMTMMTQILLLKTIEVNRRLIVRVRVRVSARFLLCYSKLAPLNRDVTYTKKNMMRLCQINTLTLFNFWFSQHLFQFLSPNGDKSLHQPLKLI